jgi:hypothetical protein
VEEPSQIVELLTPIEIVGSVFTVTVTAAFDEHPVAVIKPVTA